MKKKHLDFILKFQKTTSGHLYSLRNGGVISNSALKRGNYGSNGNTGFCVWTNSICSNRKINKDLERKKNSRRELQRRIMHQTNLFNHGGVSLNGAHRR